MIVRFLYRCRRCGRVEYTSPNEGETQADVLLRQVSVHQCDGTTADGHVRFGVSDLIGFNEMPGTEEGSTLG